MKQRRGLQLFFGMMLGLLASMAVYYLSFGSGATQAQTQHYTSFAPAVMTGSLQQLSASAQTCAVLQLSALSTNSAAIRIGAATITAGSTGLGVDMAAGAARQIPGIAPNPSSAKVALSTIYLLGTSGDKMQFDCFN